MKTDEQLIKPHFNYNVSFEDLKKKVEDALDKTINDSLKSNNVDDMLRESIYAVFKTEWTNSRRSKIREIIEDAIDNCIRNSVYEIMDKTEIKQSIRDAIETNLKDGSFIKNLANLKTLEIITSK